MADYRFQYRMNRAPRVDLDGSGIVVIFITAVYQDVTTTDPDEWFDVPERTKDFNVPAADIETVLAVPVGQAISALKEALKSNIDTVKVPIIGWGLVELEAFMDANDRATAARDALDTLITTYKVYPFVFS